MVGAKDARYYNKREKWEVAYAKKVGRKKMVYKKRHKAGKKKGNGIPLAFQIASGVSNYVYSGFGYKSKR